MPSSICLPRGKWCQANEDGREVSNVRLISISSAEVYPNALIMHYGRKWAVTLIAKLLACRSLRANLLFISPSLQNRIHYRHTDAFRRLCANEHARCTEFRKQVQKKKKKKCNIYININIQSTCLLPLCSLGVMLVMLSGSDRRSGASRRPSCCAVVLSQQQCFL